MTTKKTNNSFLDKIAAERLTKIREGRKQNYSELPILDFVPAVSPKFYRTNHLEPIAAILDAVFESPQFFTFSAPPRHGKSELIFHFIAKYLLCHPDHQVAYVTYTATLAEKRSINIREICKRAGMEFDQKMSTRAYWRTAQGGGLLARGPGGALTGEGIHLMVIDDPYRDRSEAESPVIKATIMDWWYDVIGTRIEPGGSVIVFHTRWHPEDLIGILINEHDWPHINLQALGEDGQALWPERYDAEHFLKKKKENEYTFASLYQGEPRPRGGAVFNGTYLYTDEQFAKLKEERKIRKYVIGIDCAYTAKTHADYSVAVVLAIDEDKNHYVVDVRRMQCEAPKFAGVLKELRLTYDHPTIYWYTGGIEKAVATNFRDTFGVPVKDIPAREDKFVRAQAVASAWNSGRILLPREHKPWLDNFVAEVLTFSGLADKHDDQVDALAAAFIPSAGKTVKRGMIKKRFF